VFAREGFGTLILFTVAVIRSSSQDNKIIIHNILEINIF